MLHRHAAAETDRACEYELAGHGFCVVLVHHAPGGHGLHVIDADTRTKPASHTHQVLLVHLVRPLVLELA